VLNAVELNGSLYFTKKKGLREISPEVLLPLFDTLRIHSLAAVDFALGE
jgi:hypothetical protein